MRPKDTIVNQEKNLHAVSGGYAEEFSLTDPSVDALPGMEVSIDDINYPVDGRLNWELWYGSLKN